MWLYTATLIIMSPSEVIIEVYIMPEDASLVLFSLLKDFFFYYKAGGGGMSSSLSLYNSGPDWASWPCHAVSTRPRDHRGSTRELGGVTLNSRCAVCS